MEAYCEPLEHEQAFLHKATNQQHSFINPCAFKVVLRNTPGTPHKPTFLTYTSTHPHTDTYVYIHMYTISGINVSHDIISKGHTVED